MKPEVQFYRNPRHYPTYSRTITPVGPPIEVTPQNINLRDGAIRLQVDFDLITGCNYISITRGSFTQYAFIDRVEHASGSKMYIFHYKVDPLRTYRNKLDLGNQFILRSPTPTNLYDEMLGSTDPYPEVTHNVYSYPQNRKRVLVVQSRPPSQQWQTWPWTPVTPTPYIFSFVEYDIDNWGSSRTVLNLMEKIASVDPFLISTMYTVPWFPKPSNTLDVDLYLNNKDKVGGFYRVSYTQNSNQIFTDTVKFDIDPSIVKTDNSISVVVPEAGVMEVPVELKRHSKLGLRRDTDLISGISNFMLVDPQGRPYTASVRGGVTNNIPIVGDPEQMYLSQNQNSLSTAMLGDVATIVGGVALSATGKGALAGVPLAMSGVKGLASRQAQVKDAANSFQNPPAFLGSALAGTYNSQFWVVQKKSRVTNESLVREELGYPLEQLAPLTIPTSGFIQTQNCGIKSDGTVPQWAIDEINTIFDNGLKVE